MSKRSCFYGLCFFNKKSVSLADKSAKGSGVAMQQNEELPEELCKPIIKKIKKEEFILDLKIIFGVLIYLICN